MSIIERLCAEADIAEHSLQRLTVQEKIDICVTRLNGQVYAVIDRCGHRSAPLSAGELDGDVVTCPVHQGQFSLTTGAVIKEPVERDHSADSRNAPWGNGIREMVRTLDLERLIVSSRDGSLYVELP
ncbi:MAG TPA: Rieske 2Fe-2S domain-containing protein [Chloroflexota bacterium]